MRELGHVQKPLLVMVTGGNQKCKMSLICLPLSSSNRSWRSLREMGIEKISFLHVIKFLSSQKKYLLNLYSDSTGTQRISDT